MSSKRTQQRRKKKMEGEKQRLALKHLTEKIEKEETKASKWEWTTGSLIVSSFELFIEILFVVLAILVDLFPKREE